MRSTKICRLLLILLLATTVTGCNLLQDTWDRLNGVEKEPDPVRVLAPTEDQTLFAGQPLHVKADLEMMFEFDTVIIELWHPLTNYTHTWKVPHPDNSNTMHLDEVLVLPRDVPPGNNYRLSVGTDPHNGIGIGFTLPVNVAP